MSTDFADAAPRKRGRALLIAGISGTVIFLVLVGLGAHHVEGSAEPGRHLRFLDDVVAQFFSSGPNRAGGI